MPTFEYLAVNNAGERISGTVAGGTMEQALSSLSQNGLVVERINQSVLLDEPILEAAVNMPPPVIQAPPVQPLREEERGKRKEERPEIGFPREAPPTGQRNYVATSIVGPVVGTVPLATLSFFYRQFSTMLSAGVPIVQALDTLGKQGKNLKFHQVIGEMRGHVEAGRPISAGMQRYPEVFQPLAVSMVRAGEEGGFVSNSFAMLANYTEQEIELRNLIKRTTFYPKLVLGISIPLILAVNWFIASMGAKGGLSSPLTNPVTWLWLGPLLIGIFLYFRIGLANPRLKFGWDAFILNVPYVGETVKQLCMAKFGRALGALYKGGVPVNKAIILSADACGNEYLRSKIVPAGRRLEGGAGIGDTLSATNAFSPIVMDMIYTGEQKGNLDSMLNRMADFYEEEGKVRGKQMGHVLGVVVLVGVAIYIAFILIQFYSNYASQLQGVGASE
jgi:type II secretory pathway component PulF